jgi:hypothetical protein
MAYEKVFSYFLIRQCRKASRRVSFLTDMAVDPLVCGQGFVACVCVFGELGVLVAAKDRVGGNSKDGNTE